MMCVCAKKRRQGGFKKIFGVGRFTVLRREWKEKERLVEYEWIWNFTSVFMEELLSMLEKEWVLVHSGF